jgi:hypothetical protein
MINILRDLISGFLICCAAYGFIVLTICGMYFLFTHLQEIWKFLASKIRRKKINIEEESKIDAYKIITQMLIAIFQHQGYTVCINGKKIDCLQQFKIYEETKTAELKK